MAFESSYTQKKKKKSGFEASSKMSVDTAYVKRKRDEAEKKISSFTQRYQDYFDSADSYLSRKNWDMAAPSYEDADRFKAEAESLLYELNDNRRFLASGDYAPFLDKISTTDYTKLAEAIKGEADFRKQIGSAENYKAFLKQNELDEKLARRFGIRENTTAQDILGIMTSHGLYGGVDASERDKPWLMLSAEEEEYLKRQYAKRFNLDEYNKLAGTPYDDVARAYKTEAYYNEYEKFKNNADFAEKSKYVPSYDTSKKGIGGFLEKVEGDRIYEAVNKRDQGTIANFLEKFVDTTPEKTLVAQKDLGKMTDDEIALFNYLYATEGQQAAYNFLEVISTSGDTFASIAQRRGYDVYENKLKDNPLAELAYAIPAGLNQFEQGITQLFTEEALPESSTQFAGAYAREDLAKRGSIASGAYDLLSTTSNMLPSIAVSTAIGLVSKAGGAAAAGKLIGEAAGAATLSLSASGNAYNEAIKNGYEPNDARKYATLVGASEGTLQIILGGIGALGGISSKAAKAIDKIDNVVLRVLASGALDAAGEFTEEYLQEILDPVFRNIALDEDNEVKMFTEEALYAGILGALSSVGLNAVSGGTEIAATKIADARAQRYIGSRIAKNANVDALIGETEGVENQAVQKYTDKVKRAQERQNAAALKKATGRLFDALSDAKQKKAILNKKDLLQKRVHEALEGTENAEKAEKVVLKALYTGLSKKADRDLYEKVNGAKILDDIMSSEEFKAENEALSQKERAEYHRMQRLITDKSEALKRAEALNDLDYDIAADGVAKVSGKAVDIKSIETLGADTVTLSTSDGVHDASDMALPKDDAVILNGLSRMVETTGIDRDTANIIYGMWKETEGADAISFILGAEEAIRYGKINYRGALESGVNTKALPESLRESLFKEGARMATVEAERTEAKKKKASENVAKKNGGLFAEDGVAINRDGTIDESVLTSVQKANLNGIRALAKLSPINFHIFKSRKVNGKFVATINGETVKGSPNGLYFRGTNDVWLDLNAGDFGEGTMLWTAGHEISHYIRERLPAKWKAMADYIMQEFTENDAPVDYMLEKQKAKILVRESSKNMTEAEIDDAAYEELISDALTEMLTDGTVVDYLAKVKQQDRNLWQTIMDAISDLIKRWGEILGVYKGRELDVDEAKALRAIKGAREALTEMYAEAFAEANEVVLIDSASESVAPSYSERTWTESEYVNGVGSPQNAVTPDFAMDEARAMLEEYRGGHNVYPVASEVVDEFVADYEARGKAEAVYSERNKAPTFYSHMGKVIDGIKTEKVGANGVVPYLKGKGVKNEEIKWSGIEAFLEGKKSVTKAELQEFVAGSMLQIGEQMSSNSIDLRYDTNSNSYSLYDKDGNVVDTYTYNDFIGGYVSDATDEIYTNSVELEDALRDEYGSMSSPRWGQYKLDGGENYRELVFKMPNSSYTNRAMQAHWGDAKGVLAHARIQDFTVDGKKMLFVEEIQSDWHNEGHKSGYANVPDKATINNTSVKVVDGRYVLHYHNTPLDISISVEFAEQRQYTKERIHKSLCNGFNRDSELGERAPDAPFRDNYHEYVLKRLIRMAAEEGYDSIGWTTADIQSDRWSDEFAEGYRIEYDQDIPKFLNKYGKKWGAKAGTATLDGVGKNKYVTDSGRTFSSYVDAVNAVVDEANELMAEETGYEYKASDVTTRDSGKEIIVLDNLGLELGIITKTKSETVWSMPITDSMKQSVLYEGQALYSQRNTTQLDRDYMSAVESGDMEVAQRFVDEAAKSRGYVVKAYHGTQRADRVGNVFLPERATSGPMAFFTDNKEIAEHYAKDKKDTSLAYDEEYSDYYSQFRVNKNGKSIKVQELWYGLPFAEKQRIKEAGKHITWDEDMENIVWDDDATHGLGNWDAYTLNIHKGNAIEALIDSWLESGELWGNEGNFIEVLKLAGITGVEYRDPDARHEKVYDTYLKIQTPFNTENADESFISGFEEWYSQQPDGKYDRDTASADLWDKNNQTSESFAERMRDDIENGTSHAWTSIPDSMTDYLKYLGYDGIQDRGGKGGGDLHTVWIPFESEQVKSAEPVTYDDKGNVIPLSARFDTAKKDIRYQQRSYAPTAEELGLSKDIEKENEKLRADAARLRELVRLQSKQTHGTKFTKTSVEAAASRLMKTFGMTRGKSELAKMLNGFYEYIASAEELSWEDIEAEAMKIVTYAYNSASRKPVRDSYAQEILNTVRKRKIQLTETQKAEAASIFGSYNAFRRHFMGSLNFVNEGGIPLDSVWNEWADAYPSEFPADIGEGDMISSLTETVDALKNAYDVEANINETMQDREWVRAIYDSYWDVSTLYTAADRYERDINQLKAKHRNAMREVREKRDSNMADYKAKSRATLKAVREKRDSNMAAYKARVQEMREKTSERRKTSAQRKKIVKVIKDLNALLFRGTKQKNVKEGLRDTVSTAIASAELLFSDEITNEAIVRAGFKLPLSPKENGFADSYVEALAEADRLQMAIDKHTGSDDIGASERLRKAKDRLFEVQKTLKQLDKQLEDAFAREKAQYNKATATQIMNNLADAYLKLKEADEDYLRGAYDESAYNHIKQLADSDVLTGASVRDMDTYQLDKVYQAYKMVLHTVRNANKLFGENIRKSVSEASYGVISEVRESNREKYMSPKVTAFLKKQGWNLLKPVYAFRMIGSDTLMRLYKNVRKGEDVWYGDVADARAYKQRLDREYNTSKWDLEKSYSFESVDGKKFELSLGQMMSIYAYTRRQDADKHLTIGGITFPDGYVVKKKVKGVPVKIEYELNGGQAYTLSEETLTAITTKLSKSYDGIIEYTEQMQTYLSDVMGEKGNEVSMGLYGVKLYNEKNYFPLKSSKLYIEQQTEMKGEVKIKNAAFSNARTPNANNTIVIENFLDVWGGHVNDMSMYHAFALPLEDFGKVYNFSERGKGDTSPDTVRGALTRAFGSGATSYITNLLVDLNGGARMAKGTDIVAKLTTGFKKAATFLSESVIIQQPSAIVRATAYIDPKYFRTYKPANHNKHWEEVKKYAPVAGIKEMGHFDTGMGRGSVDWIIAPEYKGFREKVGAIFKDSNYRDDLLSRGPAIADEMGWNSIWLAVKNEIADTTELEAGSQEFFERCGERFTEVIELTQVYDSVLSRSGYMRIKDLKIKELTAFMAEPTVQLNMYIDGAVQIKRNGKKGLAFAGRATLSVVTSIIVNALLKSLVYAKRDDDEDETLVEKYTSALVASLIDSINPLTLVPMVKDIVSLTQGYDVTRADMVMFSDTYNSIKRILNKVEEKDSIKPDDFIQVIANVSAFFGLHAKNLYRDIKGWWNLFHTKFAEGTTNAGLLYSIKEGWTGKATSKSDQLYEAYVKGDKEHLERVTNRYESEDKAISALKSEIAERYKNGEISAEDAAEYLINFAENENSEKYYKEKAKELGMTVEEVKEKELQDKAFWTLDKWDFVAEGGKSEDYSKYNDLYSAVETGKKLKKTIAYYKEHGASESTLRTQITEHFKPIYQKMTKSERAKTNIKGYLVNAFKECGLSEYKAGKKIDEWLEE